MAHLKESLKTGKPLSRMDTNAELQVWEKLVLGIIVIAEPAAKALCDILNIGSERKGLRVLDIAGGSSIFGMTIVTRDPTAQVTQLDWPNVNAVAKKANKERGLEGKIRFIDGEHHTADIEIESLRSGSRQQFLPLRIAQGQSGTVRQSFFGLEAGRHLRRQRLRAQRRTHRADLRIAFFRLHADAHAGRASAGRYRSIPTG